CRTKCRAREQEDTINVCSYHNGGVDGCKCCKSCEAEDECTHAQGICRTNHDDCPHGTYASTGCCGGCYCCKPVLQVIPDTNCAIKDGYCSETPECENGYYSCFGECSKTIHNSGLNTTVFGYCCINKNCKLVLPSHPSSPSSSTRPATGPSWSSFDPTGPPILSSHSIGLDVLSLPSPCSSEGDTVL
ncbi:unnamed protein product, partial [Meganyctiphanes norvegica]